MAIVPIPEETGNREQGSGIINSEAATSESAAPEAAGEAGAALPAKAARGALEARMDAVLAAVGRAPGPSSPTLRQGHLALLKRWYYRPEARRTGEIFFADGEGHWPVKAMLRGVGRVFASRVKTPTAE
jgi:hypothetical protein